MQLVLKDKVEDFNHVAGLVPYYRLMLDAVSFFLLLVIISLICFSFSTGEVGTAAKCSRKLFILPRTERFVSVFVGRHEAKEDAPETFAKP